MHKFYNNYRRRIGGIEVDRIDRLLIKRGFKNVILQHYRLLSKTKFNDPDLYLGLAFWYGVRHIGNDLELIEDYFHRMAIKSCSNYMARKELIQIIQSWK